jgi:hypothetical protein
MFSSFAFKVVGKKVYHYAVPVAKGGTLARIAAVHCTVHDQNAKTMLKVTGEFSWEIEVCCQELIEEVKRTIDDANARTGGNLSSGIRATDLPFSE